MKQKFLNGQRLIPGLNADRADMITGGMYILKSRCANMDFSDPIGVFGDAMLVPKGNPKTLTIMLMLFQLELS